MESLSLLVFGLLIGMQHALEADHLSAVATMSAGSTSRRALILRGSVWGLGHTITLTSICGVLLLLGETISPSTESVLELAVGLMIVYLGFNVLLKIFRQRMHIHFHRHGHRKVHVHVHSHESETEPHSSSDHDHDHERLPGMARALAIGMVHGAAGSAGLLVLATAASSALEAVSYVLAFGFGSILGMAAMSCIASYPLKVMEKYASWLNTATFACIGSVAILIGGSLIGESWKQL